MIADRPPEHYDGTLQRERTLAVIIGASEWPAFPEFMPAASFRRSAQEFAEYLCSPSGPNLPKANVRVQIDAFDDASAIVRGVRDFLRQRRDYLKASGMPATDLLFYYVGHGGFGEGDAFFLSVRATDQDDPLATSITADSLGRLIKESAAGLRTYLVLDCCFAASATRVFMSGGPLGIAGVKLADALPAQADTTTNALPQYGTALLCASGPREPARAPPDLPYTMFTGGLLAVLRKGDPNAPAWLSLDDVQRSVAVLLADQFKDKAVLPQIHAPQQRRGRVDLVPLFRNPARAETGGITAESVRPIAARSDEVMPSRVPPLTKTGPPIQVISPIIVAVFLGFLTLIAMVVISRQWIGHEFRPEYNISGVYSSPKIEGSATITQSGSNVSWQYANRAFRHDFLGTYVTPTKITGKQVRWRLSDGCQVIMDITVTVQGMQHFCLEAKMNEDSDRCDLPSKFYDSTCFSRPD